jgi:hypothetical protein
MVVISSAEGCGQMYKFGSLGVAFARKEICFYIFGRNYEVWLNDMEGLW